MALKTPTITIVGSLNMDIVSYVSHHPLPGETISSNDFKTSPGGKGANQAVACAKLSRTRDQQDLSAHVTMVGAVGVDSYGESLVHNLASCGVNTSTIRCEENEKTGLAIIVVDEATGQNRIILSPGANHCLRPEHFATMPFPNSDLVILQLEIPLDTIIQIIRIARQTKIPVLLNPAPAQELPIEVFRGLEHLVLNETEASFLAGCSEVELETTAGLERAGKHFIDLGVGSVVITLGAKGVYYINSTGASGLVPAFKVTVVDTTAAGDTFIGSYSLFAAQAAVNKETFDMEKAIKAANRAASWTVSGKGAQESIPWKSDLHF